MSFEDDLASAREKVRQAEESLDAHVHGNGDNHDLQKQLSRAAKIAREELIDVLSKLCPE